MSAYERAVERVSKDYEAKGFRVQREAPVALSGGHEFRADLLAERGDEHHVVEVALAGVPSSPSAKRWGEVAEWVRATPGWHFKIVVADKDLPPLPTSELLRRELETVNGLLAEERGAAALLLASSIFEASIRHRLNGEGTENEGLRSGVVLLERAIDSELLDEAD
jgi:hypothetical protein